MVSHSALILASLILVLFGQSICAASNVAAYLSERGGKIAFDSQASHQRFQAIYVMNANGSELCQLTDGTTIDRVPEFSRDGEKIAFVSWRDGNSEIYVMNADGSQPVRMTYHDSIDSYPRFSPDGKSLVFFSDREGNNEIYILQIGRNHEPKRLTYDEGNDCDPAFSPDGSSITFSSDRTGDYDIYVMQLDGSNQRNLTRSPGDDIHSTYSPDGSLLTFRSNRTGNFECYVMAADGSNVSQLTDRQGSVRHPSFSPKGRSVIFHSVTQPKRAVLRTVDLETGVVHDLTDDAAANLNAVWAPGAVQKSSQPTFETPLLKKLQSYRPHYLARLMAFSMVGFGCLWGASRAIKRTKWLNPIS